MQKTRFGTKNVVILSDDGLLTSRKFGKLRKIFSIDAEDVERGYIQDFWIDYDHVKVYGEDGRGNYEFVVHSNKTTTYIITNGDWDDENIEGCLMWWLKGCKNEIEIENNWSDWDKVFSGVAYRGGSGYCYGLYAREMKAV